MRFTCAFWCLVVACGSSHPATDAGQGDGSPVGDGGQLCGATICSAATCGATVDPCGEVVQCGLCRYDLETIPNGPGAPVLAFGASLEVAYGATVATRGTPWTTDTIPGTSDAAIDFALATDGTPWVLLQASGGDLAVAHRTAGTWTIDPLTPSSASGALAIAGDGTIVVAYSGRTVGQSGVLLATNAGAAGTWVHKLVFAWPSFTDIDVDVAVAGNAPWIVWNNPARSQLELSTPNAAGDYVAEDVGALPPNNIPFSLAIDAALQPHIAFRHNAAFDRKVEHAVRRGGVWTVETPTDDIHGSGRTRIAMSPVDGEISIGFSHNDGLSLATLHDGQWFTQMLSPACYGTAAFDVGYAADGALVIVYACPSQVGLITRAGRYPDDYASTCLAAATTLCDQACTCSTSCCVDGVHKNYCADPKSNCIQTTFDTMCGNPTQDQSAVYDCSGAVGALACNAGGTAVTVPTACTSF